MARSNLRDMVTEGEDPRVAAAEDIRAYFKKKAESTIPLLQWVMKVPEPKAGTLDFTAFPFQPEIYEAMGSPARDVVVMKATQVGISTMTIRWALYEADRNGRTVLYIFPTEHDVYDFSDTRITPLFDISEHLAERQGLPFNKGLKRVGRGLVYFRGSESKRKLDSVDGDCLALDEYDTLNQANIPDAERRLSGPLSAGLIRRIGVPSLPEYGISEKWEESDKRKWLVRCTNPKCKDFTGTDRSAGDATLRVPDDQGGWQELDFWRNVRWDEKLGGRRIVNARRVCSNCEQSLEDEIGKGKWVAQQPDSDLPGFHVSRLIVPIVRLEDIIKASKKTTQYERTVFYNKDLGLPYVASDARLSVAEIKAAMRDFEMVDSYAGTQVVTMGIDVASARALNVRISEHDLVDEELKRALWIGEIEDDEGIDSQNPPPGAKTAFEKLDDLMLRFRVNMAVIDRGPEMRNARAFANRFPGRVYLCSYSDTAKQVFVADHEMYEVTVRRTESIDAMVDLIRRQKNELPADLPDGYIGHLTANVRKVEKKLDAGGEDTGKVHVRWVSTRPDDWAMSEVYDVVAGELWWVRTQLDDAMADEEHPIDDDIGSDFRTTVHELDDIDVRLGPGDGELGGDSMYGV